MSRFEAMLAHPAGKGIPESAEVAQARMDAEAVALANSDRSRIPTWLGGIAVGLFVYVAISGLCVAAALAGGAQL